MKQKSILIAIIFSFTLVFNGYSQSHLAKYVPGDATFVVVINPNNLDSKVKLEELGKLPIFDLLMAQLANSMSGSGMQGFMHDMLSNPEGYGINYLKSPVYIFANFGEEGNRMNMAVPLSDKGKFKNFVASILPDEAAISKEGNFETVFPEQDVALAWNNDMFLFTGIEMHWDEEKYPGETADQHKEREANVTKSRVNQIMTSTGANSISRNVKYASSAGQASDLSFWLDYQQVQKFQKDALENMGGMEQIMYAQMLMQGMSSMYDDTYLAGNLNFNAGAIDLKTKLFGNQELLDLVRSMLNTKINKNFAKYVKSDNLLGYWAIGYNVENGVKGMQDMLMPMIRQIPMAGNLAEPALDVLDIVIDEDALYSLVKGDAVLAVTGMQEFKTTAIEYDEEFNATEVEKTETLPEFSLMLSTGSEENIRKLLKLGESSTMLTAKGGYHLVSVPDTELPMDIYLAVRDGILFVTNNSDLVENRLGTGYGSGLSKKHAKLFKKNSQVMYMDLPKIIDAVSTLSPEMEDPMAQTIMNGFKDVFSNVKIKSQKNVGDAVVTSMSLNFVNEDRNSMEQLLNYVNSLVMGFMGGDNM